MNLTTKNLSSLEAFYAMRLFLDRFYEQTKSDDVGSLLGDLQIAADGRTFDPAAWNDWIKCVDKVLEKGYIETPLKD